MDLAKKILILTLSLLFLSPAILPNLCSATEPPSIQTCQSPYLSEPEHSHHEDPPCNNSTPCSKNCTHCNLATLGPSPDFFVLNFYSVTPAKIFFQPSVITKSFYHPPRPHL